MTKEDVTSIAAAVMSVSASVLLIFTPDLAADSHWAARIVVTLLGAVSLYAIFAAVRWCLFRWHYRHLLGRWLYVTSASDGITFRDENFASMTFSVGFDGDLSYKVLLYPTIRGVLVPNSEKIRGRASSLALSYDVGKECVELVFLVEFSQQRPEDQTRKGRLSLHFVGPTLLDGSYISEVWVSDGGSQKRTISSGRMVAARQIEQLRQITGIDLPEPAPAST